MARREELEASFSILLFENKYLIFDLNEKVSKKEK